MKAETGLDAIETGRWSRAKYLPELRCHSDAGSKFTSIHDGERLAEIGASRSIGIVGESYDNAHVESVNGYYKAALGTLAQHTQRLHSYLGDAPPAEFEQAFYAGVTSTKETGGSQMI